MMPKILVFMIVVLISAAAVLGQQPAPAQPPPAYDTAGSVAYDISRIAQSVQAMTKTLKDFVDKFAKVEGLTLSEKQQRLVMGMELLIRAEQRMATLQKFQIELVEKDGELRSRLA
ncbi:MAG: hypothetical protein IT173_15080, partial [Acidobacteria bacterium]|nr:hypothetical protein [Acidobacteriota bacterium]